MPKRLTPERKAQIRGLIEPIRKQTQLGHWDAALLLTEVLDALDEADADVDLLAAYGNEIHRCHGSAADKLWEKIRARSIELGKALAFPKVVK